MCAGKTKTSARNSSNASQATKKTSAVQSRLVATSLNPRLIEKLSQITNSNPSLATETSSPSPPGSSVLSALDRVKQFLPLIHSANQRHMPDMEQPDTDHYIEMNLDCGIFDVLPETPLIVDLDGPSSQTK